MGRPKGSKNKMTLLRERKLVEGVEFIDSRSDTEIIQDIEDRFSIYRDFVTGTDDITSLIVSGSAGVGKSYTAEELLEARAMKFPDFRYKIIKGMISAFDLYEVGYMYRRSGDVIVLDDADAIFDDETGLNILKSLLDTSLVRRVCWMTDHPRFKGDDGLPKEFIYEGSMIFLTNKNFQAYLDTGVGKLVSSMEALMGRSLYLDLKMHSRREVTLWVNHLVTKNHILQRMGGINPAEEKMLMEWLVQNQNDLREMSLRTAINLGRVFKRNKGNKWVTAANVLFKRKDRV